jgi:hypothetical protein
MAGNTVGPDAMVKARKNATLFEWLIFNVVNRDVAEI